ncbi:hypothetical protein DXG01_012468 [Tephrocybe rancida]|nr:hypothetical protein DXG01_012468 [Tephrocybe rancida]
MPTPLLTQQEARKRNTLAPPAISTAPSSPESFRTTDKDVESPLPELTKSDPPTSESDDDPSCTASTLGSNHTHTISIAVNHRNAHRPIQPTMSSFPILNTRPLAEVKIAKLKDCLMLTAGHFNVEVFQEWANACHRYSKHSDKKPEDIVRFVADGMLEPRYVKWYHANQKHIDTLTLDEYLVEFTKCALPHKWEKTVCDSILSSKQGDQPFADWTVDLENLNVLLTNTKSPHALNNV